MRKTVTIRMNREVQKKVNLVRYLMSNVPELKVPPELNLTDRDVFLLALEITYGGLTSDHSATLPGGTEESSEESPS